METELKPTLWRTCRALANPTRLRILRMLLDGSPRSVEQVAARLRLPEPLASQYLRVLQARGIIRSERSGRHVLYRDQSDPILPRAGRLLQALRAVLGPGDAALRDACFDLTAFTHPRRIAIVRALGRGPLRMSELSRASGVPLRSLQRHVGKLCRRGVLIQDGAGVKRGDLGSALMKCLVAQATED